ncbi:MAG TPA: hypothetical protein VIY48_10145 [Candidatus Paceibacterota bacterium]
MSNVIWEASPVPTHAERGRGMTREWPAAFYVGPSKKPAAFIISKSGEECSDNGMNNRPERPLSVIILAYNMGPKKNPKPDDPIPDAHRMYVRDREFDRLEAAMAFVQLYLDQHRHWQPLIV